jgi:hypothetical protein
MAGNERQLIASRPALSSADLTDRSRSNTRKEHTAMAKPSLPFAFEPRSVALEFRQLALKLSVPAFERRKLFVATFGPMLRRLLVALGGAVMRLRRPLMTLRSDAPTLAFARAILHDDPALLRIDLRDVVDADQ